MNSTTDIPDGFEKLKVSAAYVKDDSIVLLGKPGDAHDCDLMGCGSASAHVIAYARAGRCDWGNIFVNTLTEIRDTARTGLPAGGMTAEQWAKHRLDTIADKLTRVIDSLSQG